MIAAVRVRGEVDTDREVEDTLQHLGLDAKNSLVVLEDSDSVRGMLERAKDYIAYGELGDDVRDELEDLKGEEVEPGDSFSLSPPTGGFRHTRSQAGQGGALGERKSMDHLVRRMV